MRRQWRLILPVCGLLLFSLVSYQSFRAGNLYRKHDSRYFWWSIIRLDSDPLNMQSKSVTKPCPNNVQDCAEIEFDPDNPWVVPNPLARLVLLSALPAFIVGTLIVVVLGKLGINQVLSFMMVMPLLIGAWFYLLGWLIDRWRYKRSMKS